MVLEGLRAYAMLAYARAHIQDDAKQYQHAENSNKEKNDRNHKRQQCHVRKRTPTKSNLTSWC